MRIALVSAWYIASGGVEAVDNVIGTMFPEADVFTLFSNRDRIPTSLRDRKTHHSFLHCIPRVDKTYRLFMPLYPYAVESLDLRGYDLIISSDHGVAKGILCHHDAVHIAYCHTPWRQLHDLYWKSLELVPAVLRPAYRWSAHYLRQWDYIAAQRPDHMVANSKYIQRRIMKYYSRNSPVIYPPIETNNGFIAERRDDYYLSVARLTHTKQLHLIIEACNRLKRRLVIAGEGREEARLKAIAGPTVEFAGRVPDEELKALYAHCRALVFAADEDFGIVPVEAQSYGRPVIAYGHGGSLETVRVGDPQLRGDTGVFFAHQTAESVVDGILQFEAREDSFVPEVIKRHAASFDTSVFRDKMRAFIDQSVLDHSGEYACTM
jgi:glycosyltransferase involved in cell wall biosynthesis